MYQRMTRDNKEDLKRCVSLLEKSPGGEAAEIARKFESLMDEADTVNQIQYKKYGGIEKKGMMDEWGAVNE